MKDLFNHQKSMVFGVKKIKRIHCRAFLKDQIPYHILLHSHRLQQRDQESSELGHLDIGRGDGLRQGSGGHAARRLAHALHQLLRPGAPMVGLQSEHI